jgi:hypothetical protein
MFWTIFPCVGGGVTWSPWCTITGREPLLNCKTVSVLFAEPLSPDMLRHVRFCTRRRVHMFEQHVWTFTVMSACLPRRCLAIDLLWFRRNVFSDPLPSNDHGADHIENNSCNTFYIYCCVLVFRALPRNGSTCHNIYLCLLWLRSNLKFCIEFCPGSTLPCSPKTHWAIRTNIASYHLAIPVARAEYSLAIFLLHGITLYSDSATRARSWYFEVCCMPTGPASEPNSCRPQLLHWREAKYGHCSEFHLQIIRLLKFHKAGLFTPVALKMYIDGWYHWHATNKEFGAQNTWARVHLISDRKKLRFSIEPRSKL